MRRLLAIRDVRIYLIGQGLSLFGDSCLFLAMGIWVKTLTGSSAAAGLVFFAFALPQVFAPLSGLLVDRVRRRPLLLVTNVLAGLLVLLLLLVSGRDQVWIIYLVMALYGAAYTVLSSAQSALLPAFVPDELLGEANGAFSTIRESLRLFAPLTGAGIFTAFGGPALAALDAVTFAAAAGSLILLRVQEPAPEHRDEHLWAEVTAGIRHIHKTLALRRIVLASGAAFLVIGFIETAAFAVVDQGLHRTPAFLGFLTVAQGVGAVPAGVIAARVMARIGETPLVAIALGIFGAASLLLAAPSLPVVLAGCLGIGFSLPWLVVGFTTLLQRRTPSQLLGRVFSAADLLVGVPQTASLAFGAVLVTLLDYRVVLVIVAVVVAAAGMGLAVTREEPDVAASIHTGPDAVAAP